MSWQQHAVTQTIEAHRSGWPGAWDAIKAAITGTPRLTIEKPITLSFWTKGPASVEIAQAQVESQ